MEFYCFYSQDKSGSKLNGQADLLVRCRTELFRLTFMLSMFKGECPPSSNAIEKLAGFLNEGYKNDMFLKLS